MLQNSFSVRRTYNVQQVSTNINPIKLIQTSTHFQYLQETTPRYTPRYSYLHNSGNTNNHPALSSQGSMTGLATPVKVFAFLVLVTAYVYLFGWASLARFMEGEIVISRKIYRSEAIKPPGLSEDSFL